MSVAVSDPRGAERASDPHLVEVETADRVMNRHADRVTPVEQEVNISYRKTLL
jgi:hypothetical protein